MPPTPFALFSLYAHPLVHSIIIHSFTHLSIPPSLSFIHSFIHPFIHSSIHSFIHSFLHSFMCRLVSCMSSPRVHRVLSSFLVEVLIWQSVSTPVCVVLAQHKNGLASQAAHLTCCAIPVLLCAAATPDQHSGRTSLLCRHRV